MKKSILIVGAGPVGLSAAWFLADIPNLTIQIVQKYPINDREVLSKALNINSRTMELFQNSQIQEEFLRNSFKVRKFKISTKDKLIIQNDIQKILQNKTKFPAMHIYPQTSTQRTIQKHLSLKGIQVKREMQVVSVQNSTNAVSKNVYVVIKDLQKNQTFKKQYDYVLASDGAHSSIRKMFGLKFQGETLATNIYLCDAELQGVIEHSQTIIDGQKFVIIMPIRPNYVRIMGNSKNYLQAIPGRYKIGKRQWRSEYLINNRVIERMSIGNVYFAGDAAHVHAPLGNRGMNLGIQDVYILAKLLKQNRQEQYNQVRYQIVKKFVNKVNQLSKKAFTFQNTWSKRLLPYLGPVINQMIKKDLILFIAGLDYELPLAARL